MAKTLFTHHTFRKIRLLHQVGVAKISSSSIFSTISQATNKTLRLYSFSVIGDMDLRITRIPSKESNNTKILILKKDSKVTMISFMLVKEVEVEHQYIPSPGTATMK